MQPAASSVHTRSPCPGAAAKLRSPSKVCDVKPFRTHTASLCQMFEANPSAAEKVGDVVPFSITTCALIALAVSAVTPCTFHALAMSTVMSCTPFSGSSLPLHGSTGCHNLWRTHNPAMRSSANWLHTCSAMPPSARSLHTCFSPCGAAKS
jgi:hypothetical protein